MIFNDHGNSFFLDKVPTFAVGCAEEYRPVDEGWGPRAIPPFKGAVDFSWHFVDHARREPLRPDDLPGDRGRPRHPGADGTVLGPAGAMARAGRADLRQRDPVPDPAAEPLLRDGPRAARGHRELRERRALRHSRHRRPVAPAPGRPRGLRQSASRPGLSGRYRRRSRQARRDVSGGLRGDVRQRGRGAHDVARHARRHGSGSGGPPQALFRAGFDDRSRHDRPREQGLVRKARRRPERCTGS